MFFVLKIFFWLMLFTLAFAALSLAPWVPTRKKDLERIKKIVDLKSGQVFYDLGCGDGRVAFYVSKNSPGKAIGVELALPFYLFCKLRNFFSRRKNLDFQFRNLFHVDLRQADAVYLFAADRSKLTGKIIKKFETELKAGAKIISYAFPISAWKPVAKDQSSLQEVAIYLYIKN